MNLLKIVFTILIVFNLTSNVSTIYGQEPAPVDSSKNCYELAKTLSLRIDSLEARLENLQIQVVESDPLMSAKYLRWGKGLTFSFSMSAPRLSTEIGYTILTPKSFRMEIAGGFDLATGPESELPGYSFYGKVNCGTPVFINFISMNSYFRTIYFPKKAIIDTLQNSGGIGAGAEFEFWFMPSFCYTFGGSVTILSNRYSFVENFGQINFAGIKFFPQCSRKKK
jgi:hypothetical protein